MQLILSILKQVKIIVPKEKMFVEKHSFCYLHKTKKHILVHLNLNLSHLKLVFNTLK